MHLDGKVVVVTGGTAGIGLHCAQRLVEAGAKVAVLGRDATRGREVESRLGHSVMFRKCDVSEEASCDTAFTQVRQLLGGVDHAINSAGVLGPRCPFWELSHADWSTVIATNLTGVFLSMRAVVKSMRDHAGCSIVNIASVVGMRGFPGLPAYCASKAGVIQLSRVAALELAPRGIRVNAVCPGSIQSEMLDDLLRSENGLAERLLRLHPIGRLGTLDDVWGATKWLLSSDAAFTTGHALPVAGGWETK